jgi:NNP family nitrate/nitrite transporter-like MFS transporter
VNAGQKLQLTLSTVAFAVSFAVWGVLGALAPILRQELNLSQTQVSLMVAIPVLLGSVGRLPMGILAERYGGRVMMTLLLAFAIVPAAGIALSNSYGALIFWAFFLGLAGTSFSIGVAFTSKWFSPQAQGTALGIFGAGNIGQSIAVFFAPRLANLLDTWRPVVWGFAIASVIWAAVFWSVARDARPGQAKPLSAIFALLGRSPMAWLLSLFYFVTFGGFVAMGVYLPTLLVNRYGLPLADAGMRAAGFVVIATLARPIGGMLSDRLGGARVLSTVLAVAVGAALLLVFENFYLFTAGALILAAALGLGNGAVFKLVPQYFPADTGSVTGLVGAFGGLGGFFPPLVLGVLLDRTGSYTFGFLLLSAFALGCCLAALRLARGQAVPATTPAR